MKKQSFIYLGLVMIFLASLACNVGTQVDGQEPAVESGQTGSDTAIAPSTQAGGDDGSASAKSIDLANPALYIVPNAPAYKFESTVKYTGVDTAGIAKEVSEIGSTQVQTLPQPAQRFQFSLEGYMDGAGTTGSINILSSDTVIIGDQMTSAQMVSVNGGTPELHCNTGSASEMQGAGMLESLPKIQEMLSGTALLVERGIEINGLVTDKYELSADNFVGDDKPDSAFVYVAREGGFITLFEMQSRANEKRYGFDPNQLTSISVAYSYIPVVDGSLDIASPAECGE